MFTDLFRQVFEPANDDEFREDDEPDMRRFNLKVPLFDAKFTILVDVDAVVCDEADDRAL